MARADRRASVRPTARPSHLEHAPRVHCVDARAPFCARVRSGRELLGRKAHTRHGPRRQSAEKRAATAPVKMVLPLGLLIFPALFILILGPAVLNIAAQLKGR
jgi:hypothetical protein